ncbi:polysaccharide deacetylase family protein [Nitrosopumilus adriaticus]|uniref:polysaccharide deacetylase family protein n=1 Tax=Nitrosopumilus adriaticus TaxID=1580092 RepID=UPI00352C055B
MNKVIIFSIIFSVLLSVNYVDSALAEESETIEVEIKYTNGDRADFNGMKLIVYQDFNKEPLLEKNMSSNPDVITVPENHRYKIEVYTNGVFGDVEYIQLGNTSKKVVISIPISGGIQFEVFYKNGETPIEGATLILKSPDNSELARDVTNDLGETTRYWIQSTTKEGDYYIADVYLDEIFLTSYFPIKVQSGLAVDQKIVTNISEIVEDLITINLFDGSKKITSKDGDYQVVLLDKNQNQVASSNLSFRGDAQFSNLKTGVYTVKINSDKKIDDKLWPQNNIQIIGDSNKFSIFKNSEQVLKKEKPFYSCNCISFRLDDVQDYWLADAQIEIINLFAEKKIPLSVGVIGNLIGGDERIVSVLKENLANNNIEIVNHSWNNDALTNFDEKIQEDNIVMTNNKIFEVFGVTPKAFIPPQNLYNENTVNILKRNGFTHINSHIDRDAKTQNIDDIFFNVPAITETGVLLDDVNWKLQEKDHIKEEIIQNIDDKGYAIIMMHPQEFSLNEAGEYSSPNQKSLTELRLLLDEVSQLDAKLVKLTEVIPKTAKINQNQTSEQIGNTEIEIDEESTEKIPVEEKIDSCKCIAFRLDDVQDYWLNNVQISIMETFIENKTPLTIGIIANAFGNDQKITEYIVNSTKNNEGYLEIASRGIGLNPFTNYDKIEQSENLKESLDRIESILDIRPHVFLPPNNKFNEDTFDILKENNITHISSSLTNGDEPPFEFKNQEFYRFPQITSTGKYNPTSNTFERISNDIIIAESEQGISNYGFAVISIHPQEFSTITNSTYANSVNQEQIIDLEKLIKEFKDNGYKIVTIGKINSNLIVLVPEWIKNNAGWWAEGAIDDSTFVQGIEYLVKQEIIKVSERSQTQTDSETVPEWIKNNAGWWAEGAIDDKTFVQGIEYLVKNGIISY